MTTTWANSGCAAELAFGDAQPAGDLVLVVGAAPDQPGSQRLERGRRDEHLDGLGHRRPDLAGALDLDLEDDRDALG